MAEQVPVAGPVVAVRGEAVLEVDPEIATFSAGLAVSGRDRPEVLRRVGELHKQVWSSLVELGDALDVETGGVWVHPRYDDQPAARRPPWYDASAQVTVEVSDFALIPDVLRVLGGVREASVSGPSWGLRPDSDAHRRARTTAIRDALRRAEECAAALGCTLVELVDLTDGDDPGADAPLAMRMAADAGGPESGGLASVDLRPVRQWIRGGVRARFRMTVPDLDVLLADLGVPT